MQGLRESFCTTSTSTFTGEVDGLVCTLYNGAMICPTLVPKRQ